MADKIRAVIQVTAGQEAGVPLDDYSKTWELDSRAYELANDKDACLSAFRAEADRYIAELERQPDRMQWVCTIFTWIDDQGNLIAQQHGR